MVDGILYQVFVNGENFVENYQGIDLVEGLLIFLEMLDVIL